MFVSHTGWELLVDWTSVSRINHLKSEANVRASVFALFDCNVPIKCHLIFRGSYGLFLGSNATDKDFEFWTYHFRFLHQFLNVVLSKV